MCWMMFHKLLHLENRRILVDWLVVPDLFINQSPTKSFLLKKLIIFNGSRKSVQTSAWDSQVENVWKLTKNGFAQPDGFIGS